MWRPVQNKVRGSCTGLEDVLVCTLYLYLFSRTNAYVEGFNINALQIGPIWINYLTQQYLYLFTLHNYWNRNSKHIGYLGYHCEVVNSQKAVNLSFSQNHNSLKNFIWAVSIFLRCFLILNKIRKPLKLTWNIKVLLKTLRCFQYIKAYWRQQENSRLFTDHHSLSCLTSIPLEGKGTNQYIRCP